MKRFLYASTIAGLLSSGCSNLTVPPGYFSYKNVPDQTVPDQAVPDHPSEAQVLYHNTQYNFTFSMPTNWQRYSVLSNNGAGKRMCLPRTKWWRWIMARSLFCGTRNGSRTTLSRYPHPGVTRSQWKAEHQGQFFIYEGGLVFEIAHNAKYVFGIWSRFNGGESIRVQGSGGHRHAESGCPHAAFIPARAMTCFHASSLCKENRMHFRVARLFRCLTFSAGLIRVHPSAKAALATADPWLKFRLING